MNVNEIAPDVYRISTYIPEINLQFNQFLVDDDEPLLFHTGMKGMFPIVREAVSTILDPERIRWIGFSHFEADECGSLNEWLEISPHAEPICSVVGAMVSVNDFSTRPARALNDEEIFETGKKRFRFLQTPHVPHCWEASLLFEETDRVLFCSDLFTHGGDGPAQTENDVVEPFTKGLLADQSGPLANAYSYNANTDKILRKLATLKPATLAIMHGSSYRGDGEKAINDLATAMGDVLGGEG